MEVFELIAAVSIFAGGITFASGFDKRPRLDGHNEVYKRRLKLRMAMGVALGVAGAVYLIKG